MDTEEKKAYKKSTCVNYSKQLGQSVVFAFLVNLSHVQIIFFPKSFFLRHVRETEFLSLEFYTLFRIWNFGQRQLVNYVLTFSFALIVAIH